jgi:hypothetical protein
MMFRAYTPPEIYTAEIVGMTLAVLAGLALAVVAGALLAKVFDE